jgi:hypothetical protein
MTGKTRYFWLLSDHKTVREVDIETARKLAQKNRHVVFVHDNHEFYTTKKWIPMRQFIQCVDLEKVKP